VRLENAPFRVYGQIMDNLPDNTPPGWAEILEESEAEADAGVFVPAEEVHRLFREAKAKRKSQGSASRHEATAHH
jgi:hypothetical protein